MLDILAELTLPNMTTRHMIALVIVVIGTVYLMFRSSQWMRGKRGLTPTQSQAKAIQNLTQAGEIRHQLEKLIVDLEELARQINGHIDTRFCKLEVLIRHADQRIKKLEELTGVNVDAVKSPTPKTPTLVKSSQTIASSTKNAAPITATPAPAPTEAMSSDDLDRQSIYRLADSGENAINIAKLMNRPAGEIELILSLRRNARTTPPTQNDTSPGARIDFRVDD